MNALLDAPGCPMRGKRNDETLFGKNALLSMINDHVNQSALIYLNTAVAY